MAWLADKIRKIVAVKGHSPRTTEAYTHWARELMGHANVETTMIYTHVEAAPVRCFVNLLAS